MKIELDPADGRPAYQRVAGRIEAMVRNGDLEPGARLPSERAMALSLNLARGTVKRALEVLERGRVVEVVRGRGCYVSASSAAGRGDRAMAAVDRFLDEMDRLKFAGRQILSLVEAKIAERKEQVRGIHVAAVGFGPEALLSVERQVGRFFRGKPARISMNRLRADARPETRMSPFDLILTLPSHQAELAGLLPGLRDRILSVSVSPRAGTLVELARLNPGLRVGVIYGSPQFLGAVRGQLEGLGVLAGTDRLPDLRTDRESELPGFLDGLDVVVVPPGHLIDRRRDTVYAVQRFTGRGGRIVVFENPIERGSLLHVEERIRRLMNR